MRGGIRVWRAAEVAPRREAQPHWQSAGGRLACGGRRATRYVAPQPRMELPAPAKINLHLRVGRRRDDGFHPLLSWMCSVALFDTLKLEADGAAEELPTDSPPAQARASGAAGEDSSSGPAAPRVEFEVFGDGDRPDLPRDGSNLVVRIATAFLTE